MADKKVVDSPFTDPKAYEATLAEKKQIYKEKLFNQHDSHRGGRFKPFAIEHLPNERARLAVEMTPEDRLLRKQWVKDQILHPNEPLRLPELWPRNVFRRFYMAPWDAAYKRLIPHMGQYWAIRTRAFVPKLMLSVLGIYAFYYHMKYNQKDWTKSEGWLMYTNKPRQYPHEAGFDPLKYEKSSDDFHTCGFETRTAMLDLKTSRGNYE